MMSVMRRAGLLGVVVGGLLLACGGGGGTDENPPPPPPPPPPPAPVATVTVTPAADTLVIKAPLQLVAVPTDSAGTTLTGRTITWSVTDPALASVSATGQVTGLLPGVVQVVATAEQKSDTATLTLVPLLTLVPRLPSLFVGDTVHLIATLRDALGGAVAGTVTWTSRQAGTATVAGGVVTGVDSGLVTVVASGTAFAESVVVAVLRPRLGVNREIAYLTDSARADGQQVPTARTYLPGDASSKRVSALGEYVNEYAWSADGSRLVFSYVNLNGVGRAGMWAANADGSGELQVGAPGSHPRWAPDGSRIAFRSATNPARIVVAQANGGGAQNITTGPADDLDPEWSPDGRQIVFRRQTTFCEQMWIMDATGGNARQVTVPVSTCQFRWSPDGKLIVIQGSDGLSVVRPDGTGFQSISGAGGSDPDWSPDGSKVVFTKAQGWVYTWARATGAVDSVQVPQLCCSDVVGPVHWSPDGQKLLYLGPYLDPQLGVVLPLIGVMNADGSNQVPVINFHRAQGSGTWRP